MKRIVVIFGLLLAQAAWVFPAQSEEVLQALMKNSAFLSLIGTESYDGIKLEILGERSHDIMAKCQESSRSASFIRVTLQKNLSKENVTKVYFYFSTDERPENIRLCE